jgi:epoxyqueuosine reductase
LDSVVDHGKRIIMEEKIREILKKFGADDCGIANVERFANAPAGFHPRDVYKECKSVIVFAKCMPKGLAFVSPRISYIRATDSNLNELDRIGLLASVEIEKSGAIAVPIPCDSPYEYWDSEKLEGRGILSMRHAAQLSGLGSMGKSTLIISKKFGTMLNFGAILTNLDLKSDPLSEEICLANCCICIDNCPQKALNGLTVNQKLCREYTYTQNKRGFQVCNCNKCRVGCPGAFGMQRGKG